MARRLRTVFVTPFCFPLAGSLNEGTATLDERPPLTPTTHPPTKHQQGRRQHLLLEAHVPVSASVIELELVSGSIPSSWLGAFSKTWLEAGALSSSTSIAMQQQPAAKKKGRSQGFINNSYNDDQDDDDDHHHDEDAYDDDDDDDDDENDDEGTEEEAEEDNTDYDGLFVAKHNNIRTYVGILSDYGTST